MRVVIRDFDEGAEMAEVNLHPDQARALVGMLESWGAERSDGEMMKVIYRQVEITPSGGLVLMVVMEMRTENDDRLEFVEDQRK